MFIAETIDQVEELVKDWERRAKAKVLSTCSRPRSYDHVFACGQRGAFLEVLDLLRDHRNQMSEAEALDRTLTGESLLPGE